MSEFVWNEKLVLEFLRWFATSHSPEEQEETLAKFKASKQPKPEWEITAVIDGCICGHNGQNPMGKPIYRVRRNSDMEEFEIGNVGETRWVDGHYKEIGEIESFYIFGTTMRVRMKGGKDRSADINLLDLHHPKNRSAVYLTNSQLEKLLTLLK
jgi:hypothetical protein